MSVTQARPIEASHESSIRPPFLWMTTRDISAIAAMTGLGLTLLMWNWFWSAPNERVPGTITHQVEVPGIQIDINTAAQAEFMLLDGIGPALAKRIIEDRAQRGPFRSVNDLDRVKGIGPKLIEKNRRWMKHSSE